MGFLKDIYRGLVESSDKRVARALQVDRHGSFLLTKGIRTLGVVPQQGYRRDLFEDDEVSIPVLMAAASREVLFDLFLELLGELPGEVDVCVDMTHGEKARDLPVLKSKLLDYEDVVLHDGCTGISVIHVDSPAEVQLDEHKLLLVYSQDLPRFEAIFRAHGVAPVPELNFLSEGEHVHATTKQLQERLAELLADLGAEDE